MFGILKTITIWRHIMKINFKNFISIILISSLMIFTISNLSACNSNNNNDSLESSEETSHEDSSENENSTNTDFTNENSSMEEDFSEGSNQKSSPESNTEKSDISEASKVPTKNPTSAVSPTTTPSISPSGKPPYKLNYDGLGFNYWPGGFGCDVLYERNWTEKNKEIIRSDLNMMASFGTKAIRLMFWPQLSGWAISENQGGTFNSNFDATIKNLPELIKIISEYDMKVIIAYGNNYLDLQTTQGVNWWRWAYGNDGFQKFLDDTIKWAGAIVKEAEKLGISEHILYYDFQNEVFASTDQVWTYVRYLYDNLTDIKSGKRGISTLFAVGDPEHLADALNLGRKRALDYIAFHSYPGHNQDVKKSYNNMKSIFPNSVILLGEFGCSSVLTSEKIQREMVDNFIKQAVSEGVSNYIHWMFVDQAPNADNQRFGLFNYDRNPLRRTPKEALNLFTKNNLVRDDLSTGEFSVEGKYKLYVNFFYKTTNSEVYYAINYYDTSGNLLQKQESGKAISSATWTSISYHLQGSKGHLIPAGAKTANIQILSNGNINQADVDLLSFYIR